jgi:hypothetical protein
VYVLLSLLFFQGLSGVWGGINLVLDPTGNTLQIPLEWLEGSPFSNYLLPGFILLLVLGLYPLGVSYGLWRRSNGSWFAAVSVGGALIIWIAVEILIIGYHPRPPLQSIYGSVGLAILALAMVPSVRQFSVDSRGL